MKTSLICLVLAVFLAPLTAIGADAPFMAVISKIDGDGVAKVRRKSGIQSVAGKQQKLFPGDTITTDAKSTVELILPDGTLVRVGLNTDYKIISVDKKPGFLSWVFDMTKGSIRALVEKGVNKKQVKFRVNTPVGTMGVRGTELVLVHDPKTAVTTLYTIEGLVQFGAKNCVARRNCIEVKTGETASVGGSKAEKPQAKPFSSGDLLGLKAADEKAKGEKGAVDASMDPNSTLSRAALLEDLKDAERFAQDASQGMDVTSKGSVDDLVKKASEAMADAQDKLLGRTKADREALHKAIQDGTLADRLKLADAVDNAKTGKKMSATDRAEENLSGTTLTDKLKLSEAVLQSKEFRKFVAKSAQENGELQSKIAEAERRLKEVKESAAAVNNNNTFPDQENVGSASQGAAQEELAMAEKALENPEVADGILSDETVVNDYYQYTYKKKECFLMFCSTETRVGREAKSTTETKVTKGGGHCYQTVKNCTRKMIPCDLSQGKYCKPTFEDGNCTEEKKEVACPQ